MTCINCGCEIGQQFTFQGVVICGDCYKIVSHFIQRAKTEMKLLYLTYTDMLRVSLIRGQLRPPRLPEKSTNMPRAEFLKALQQQIKEFSRANSTKKTTDGNGAVQGVWGTEDDTRRELRGRPDDQGVPRGRESRPLPQVQEDQHADDRGDPTTGSSDPADGLDQAPRR